MYLIHSIFTAVSRICVSLSCNQWQGLFHITPWGEVISCPDSDICKERVWWSTNVRMFPIQVCGMCIKDSCEQFVCIQYRSQVTWQTRASDTRVVYAPLVSQFLAHTCTWQVRSSARVIAQAHMRVLATRRQKKMQLHVQCSWSLSTSSCSFTASLCQIY